MIYLYVKTHQNTGLKYLGKTSSKDPYSYPGSGKRWRSHLDKHGYSFDTEILLESEDPVKIKEAGLHYSKIWNIVEDVQWANLKPESGDGGTFNHTDDSKKKIGNASRGRPSLYKGMSYEEIQKDSNKAKERIENHKKWMLENNPYRGKHHSEDTKEKMKESASKRLTLTEDERKQSWGHLKGKPWSEARKLAQANRKQVKTI
jgi:hypothetical protein